LLLRANLTGQIYATYGEKNGRHRLDTHT
jgi:hypothetical protein